MISTANMTCHDITDFGNASFMESDSSSMLLAARQAFADQNHQQNKQSQHGTSTTLACLQRQRQQLEEQHLEMMRLEQQKMQILQLLSKINRVTNSSTSSNNDGIETISRSHQEDVMLNHQQRGVFGSFTNASLSHFTNSPSIQSQHHPDMQTAMTFSGNGIVNLRNSHGSSDSGANASTPRGLMTDDAEQKESQELAPYTVHQAGRWQQRFQELVDFKNEYGHCSVPSHWPQNSALAQWVKRQRSQFKLLKENKHSNMTQERQNLLDRLGFVWDSHSVFWEERFQELVEFTTQYGHPNVPTRYPPNQPLAVWCKCQRRQYKLHCDRDKRSNITTDRIHKLKSLGFNFFPRKSKV